MKNKKKAAPKGSTKSQSNPNKVKKISKAIVMLKLFVKGGRYHRFTAEQVGDHCLPSTVSDLQKRYGIYFDRRKVKTPNRFGGQTSVMLYWLTGENIAIAERSIEVTE